MSQQPEAPFKFFNEAVGLFDETYVTDEIKEKLDAIRGMPFWINNPNEHQTAYELRGRKCCFNHYVGEPWKNGRPHPMYDYEINIFRLMFEELKRHIYVKKSRGLGITEFILRMMAWLPLYSDTLKGKQMAIVTGPRQRTSEGLMIRMKALFKTRLNIDFPYNSTTLILNGCRILVHPSRNVAALRGQEDLQFIFIDEADFFPRGDQDNVRDAVEGYIGKTDPIIMLVSTPNEPNGLFQRIENEPTEEQIRKQKIINTLPCLYERLYYDYTIGEGKVYSPENIMEAKKSASWLREYCLQYGYGTGTIFSMGIMDDIKALGERYRSDYTKVNPYTMKSMGIDPAFGGSSGSAITITELLDNGIVRVIYSKRRMGLDYGELTDWTIELRNYFDPNKIYVDGWHVGFIRTLKKKFGERWKDEDLEILKARAKKYKQPIEKYMHVIPVQFSGRTREILTNTKDITEQEAALAIDAEEFRELYMDMLSAKQDDGKLQKPDEDPKDLFESLEMCLLYYTASTQSNVTF